MRVDGNGDDGGVETTKREGKRKRKMENSSSKDVRFLIFLTFRHVLGAVAVELCLSIDPFSICFTRNNHFGLSVLFIFCFFFKALFIFSLNQNSSP